jgi:hypothetical protein
MSVRLYLDTSVVSARVDDRLPERRQATVDFWDRLTEYEVAISELTLSEIQATTDPAIRHEMEASVRGVRYSRSGWRAAGWRRNKCGGGSSRRLRWMTRCTWRLRCCPGEMSW